MPRYHLVLKDETYLVLLQEAMKQGKSFGKLVNEILNAYAAKLKQGEAGQLPPQAICIVCGRKANYVGYGKGQQKLFVCSFHKNMLKDFEGYGEIQP
jgi:hypothetical protein